jgi:hypothetical protein
MRLLVPPFLKYASSRMPIPVSCRCGKSFAANDNLAGKTVKCPACQQPLAIPALGMNSATAAPRTQAATQPTPQRTAEGKIVVACACGAKFAAGVELAGKRVKCPKCGQPLTVGSAPAAKPKVAATGAQAGLGGVAAPVAESVAPGLGGDFGLASLLDEAGVKQRASGENACPSCGEFLAPEAVLCIHCGFDRKAGKKLTTETIKKVEIKKLGPPTAAAKAGAAKASGAAPVNPYASPSAYTASTSAPAAELSAMDYLFCIFCGWIALIVIIIYIAQGNPKGKPMLIVWCVVQAIGFAIGFVLGIMGAVMNAGG